MIFRAIFWIGLVSLLAPREPDLGLGRPDTGRGLLAVFHLNTDARVTAGLADVKAQIEADQQARHSRVKAI